MPLVTAALIAAGTQVAVKGGQAIAKGVRAKKQREAGEQIAQDAMKRLDDLQYQTGPQFGITQESRDLLEAQKTQGAEAIKNLREQNLALSQQAIASGVQDPTRSSAAIANIAPSLSRQLAQSEFAAAQQSTAAQQRLADLAEGYSKANILREQQISDLNIGTERGLQEQLRREGQTAASLGYAAGTEALQQGIGAIGEGVGTYYGMMGYGAPSGDTAKTAQQLGLSTAGQDSGSFIPSSDLTATMDVLGKEAFKKRLREHGGSLKNQLYMTGGEFNHDTNKKALIDEETGEKEAELTGEEVVLNPDQTNSTMEAVDVLNKFLESNPDAPEEVKRVAELLNFLNSPNFQVGQKEIEIEIE